MSTEDVKRFAIPDRVLFETNAAGEVTATLLSPQSHLKLALRGGHVQGWRLEGQTNDVLWMSDVAPRVPGKPHRGGVPICWPWFGAHRDCAKLPSHGVARTTAFDVVDTHCDADWTCLSMTLADRSQLPAAYSGLDLSVHVRVGPRMVISLETTNGGPDTVELTQALHTYFAVGDIVNIAIRGLEGCSYADALEGLATKSTVGDITFDAEVDRIYTHSGGSIRLVDPGLDRTIQVESEGSRSCVVWNPWIEKSERLGDMAPEAYRRMVCIETANAGADIIKLEPGQRHRLTAEISVAPLSQ